MASLNWANRCWLWFVLLTATAIISPGCGSSGSSKDESAANGDPAPKEVDHTTPQKITADFRKAAKADDWPTAFACVTTESKIKLLAGAHQPAAMTTTGSEMRVRNLNSLLESYGVDPAAGSKGLHAARNKGALFAKLIKSIQKNSPGSVEAGVVPLLLRIKEIAESDPEPFKVEGDSAESRVVGKSKQPTRILLKRVNEKWLLDFSESNAAQNTEK